MTEKKRPPVIAGIYHAGFSALLTPGSAAVNAGCGHSLPGEGLGCMLCFPFSHALQ